MHKNEKSPGTTSSRGTYTNDILGGEAPSSIDRPKHARRIIDRAMDLSSALLDHDDERALSLLIALRSQLEYIGSVLVSAAPTGTTANVEIVGENSRTPRFGHHAGEIEREACGDLLTYCIAVESAAESLQCQLAGRDGR